MIDITSKKLIKKENLNNWDHYRSNLGKYDYISKYMGDIFKRWVEELDNPLYMPWLINLLNNDMTDVNNNFMTLELDMGEINLTKIFSELKSEKTNSPWELTKKYYSLVMEMKVFYYLDKQGLHLEKIGSLGDWKCGNTIISVKSKGQLDFNLLNIEGILRGLFYVEENDVIRDFNRISFSDELNIDYNFRNKIDWYLDTKLMDHLNYFTKNRSDWNYIKFDLNKHYVAEGCLDVLLEAHRDDSRIDLNIKEERFVKTDKEHRIKISFKNDNDYQYALDIDNGYNVWWDNPQMVQSKLDKYVLDIVRDFDESYTKAKQQGFDFEAWIVIPVHYIHGDYIAENNREILEHYKSIIRVKVYKVNIFYSMEQCLGLKGPIVLEI